MPKIHSVKPGQGIRTFRSTLPYPDMMVAIERDGETFLEGVKRQTAHKAAKILSREMNAPIEAYAGALKSESGYTIKGYFLTRKRMD